MNIPDTFFCSFIMNLERIKPRDDGSYFIDRDPLVFDRIMEYFRSGKLDKCDMTPREIAILNNDLDYYQIPENMNAT